MRLGRIAFPALLCLLGVLFLYRYMIRIRIYMQSWGFGRQQVAQELQEIQGKHPVFAEYSLGHKLSDEWVFNEPDIPSAKIVCARDGARTR